MTGGLLILDSNQPVRGNRDRDPLMHQWLFDVQLPALPAPNPVVGIAGQPFMPDLDVAVVADPSYPERRCQPLQIRFGKAAVAPSGLARASVYAIRRGRRGSPPGHRARPSPTRR